MNRDLWLNALREAEEPQMDSDAITAQEFAAIIGLSDRHARRRMTHLVKTGKARVTKKRIQRSDGQRIVVTAYELVKEQQ